MNNTSKKQSGFTLVELAIVMIIIGLLIGGVLKGQQLIQNAKTTAVINEIKSYQAAFNSFQDTYGAVPGDMRGARDRISGCNDDNNCEGGNGNSLIDPTGSASNIITARGRLNHSGFPEPSQAWKHMALANLITGVQSDADVTVPEQLAWGSSHPASSARGGWELMYIMSSVVTGFPGNTSGHMLRLTNQGVDGGAANSSIGFRAGVNPLSPLEASNIDRKIDDGLPASGSFRASLVTISSGGGLGGCTNFPASFTDVEYLELNKSKDCNIYFYLD